MNLSELNLFKNLTLYHVMITFWKTKRQGNNLIFHKRFAEVEMDKGMEE